MFVVIHKISTRKIGNTFPLLISFSEHNQIHMIIEDFSSQLLVWNL